MRIDRRLLFLMEEDGDDYDDEAWFFWVNLLGAVICVAFVALISCLFLGFLTLDKLDLQVKARAAVDADERHYATLLLPVVVHHHRLLVTLLLLNAIAYEALPLFLDRIVPSWAAILLSVTFLLIFGEIIPSAIFTGPDQLRLASGLVPLVEFFLWVLYPIAMPLTKLLDAIVPHDDDENAYHRGELSALVRIQYEEREAKRIRAGHARTVEVKQREWGSLVDDKREWKAFKKEIMEAAAGRRSRSRSNSLSSTDTNTPQMDPLPLHQVEVRLVEGSLTMKTKIAMDVYTPLRSMFSIPSDFVLNKRHVTEIYAEGYSRIPVYDPHPNPKLKNRRTAIRGVLMARQLILVDWDDERLVETVPLLIPPCVSPRMNLVDLLKLLQQGGSLMAFVCAQPNVASRALADGKAIPPDAGFMGLVTLEDVLESVLQDRIYDELDMTDRNLASARLTQWAVNTLQRFLRKKRKKALEAKNKNEVGKTIDMEEGEPLPPNDCTPLLPKENSSTSFEASRRGVNK